MMTITLQIALIPVYNEVPVRVDTTPLPSEEMVYCNNLEFDVTDSSSIPDQCKKFMFSIGAAIQEKALCKLKCSSVLLPFYHHH